MHAHAHADNAPLLRTCNARVCYGVVQCLKMFGEKISASPGSSKEIAGLLRNMMMMMMKMERILAWQTGGR